MTRLKALAGTVALALTLLLALSLVILNSAAPADAARKDKGWKSGSGSSQVKNVKVKDPRVKLKHVGLDEEEDRAGRLRLQATHLTATDMVELQKEVEGEWLVVEDAKLKCAKAKAHPKGKVKKAKKCGSKLYSEALEGSYRGLVTRDGVEFTSPTVTVTGLSSEEPELEAPVEDLN